MLVSWFMVFKIWWWNHKDHWHNFFCRDLSRVIKLYWKLPAKILNYVLMFHILWFYGQILNTIINICLYCLFSSTTCSTICTAVPKKLAVPLPLFLSLFLFFSATLLSATVPVLGHFMNCWSRLDGFRSFADAARKLSGSASIKWWVFPAKAI